jgi:DNA-binding NarL/FixJ family response regulator
MSESLARPSRSRPGESGVHLAELMAALSIATDLGMGQPLESALCACVVGMRLGEALNLDDQTLRDVYYQALLRYIGCNADTYAMAALFGDELALRRDFAETGHHLPPARRDRPAGLSDREVEVLRLIARGLANRHMAEQLSISPDTVKHHVQHIYTKIGVSTRAGATLFAMENALL